MKHHISSVNMYYPNPYGVVPQSYGSDTAQANTTSTPTNTNVNAPTNEEDSTSQYFPMIWDVVFGKSDEQKLANAKRRLAYLQQALAAAPGTKAILQPQIDAQREIIRSLEEKAQADKETRFFMFVYKVGGAIAAIGVPTAIILYLTKKAGK